MSETPAIRPFSTEVPEPEIEALRSRVAATRWPDRETVADHSQGPQLSAVQELARHWADGYDWRQCEARLNAVPQFRTEIDGLDIHFIHARSSCEGALPVIMTHGWPGSVLEFLKVVGPLTDPVAHGGSAADAFHVVIPSIPGYGFSARPAAAGWDPARTARAWATLMQRLGYDQFVAQGGDWGAVIVDVMAEQQPPGLLGMHSNMPGIVPLDVAASLQSATGVPAGPVIPPGGTAPPDGLSAEEQHAYGQLLTLYATGIGYAQEMASQPQTLYGIADSPVGLAAWMINHDARSYELISRAIAGDPAGDLTRDDVLDNITLYWVTNTAISAARMYWENKFTFFNAKNVTIPAAVSVFPDELYQTPRSWAERAYPNLIYYNKLDKGGHFAAWDQPGPFAGEVRAAFRTLR